MLNQVMPYNIKYDNQVINGSMFLFNIQSDEKKLPYMLFVPEDMKDNSSLVVGNCSTQKRLKIVVDIYKNEGIDIDMRYYKTDHFGIVSPNVATMVANDVYDFVSRNMEYGSKTM